MSQLFKWEVIIQFSKMTLMWDDGLAIKHLHFQRVLDRFAHSVIWIENVSSHSRLCQARVLYNSQSSLIRARGESKSTDVHIQLMIINITHWLLANCVMKTISLFLTHTQSWECCRFTVGAVESDPAVIKAESFIISSSISAKEDVMKHTGNQHLNPHHMDHCRSC